MTRDLVLFTFLLCSICCGGAENLNFENSSGNESSNDESSDWVCDLGRTTGLEKCLLFKIDHVWTFSVSNRRAPLRRMDK